MFHKQMGDVYYWGFNYWIYDSDFGFVLKIPLPVIWENSFLLVSIYLNYLRKLKKVLFDYGFFWRTIGMVENGKT